MSQIVDSIAFRRPVQFNDGQAPIPTIAPNHFLNPYASSDWTRKSNVHAIADNNIASKRYERTTVDKPNRASGYSQSSTKDVQKRSSSLVPNHLIPAITQLPVYQGEDVSHVSALTSMPATGMVMRHARVELSMHLNSMMCVSGGFASGHLELQCKSRHGVRFGEIWVELQGYEQVMSQKLGALQRIQDITRIGGARIERHPLVNARVYIQTAASHLPKIPASAAVDAATGPDIQGCWQARPGNTKLPWQLAIPTNLPSIFKSRLAKVKYRVVAAIDVLYRHRKQTVIAICDLPLCEMLDHQYQLSQLLSTACTQESSCVLKRGVLKRRHPKMFCSKKSASSVDTTQIVERQKIDCEIKLRVRINRSVWVAGNTGYVEVCLKADNIKRITGINLILQQKIKTFKKDDLQKSKAVHEQTKKLVESLYRGKTALKDLKEPSANGWRIITLKIDIPEGIQSVQNALHFSVIHLLRVAVNLSRNSYLSIAMPIAVVHPASLDMSLVKQRDSNISSHIQSINVNESNALLDISIRQNQSMAISNQPNGNELLSLQREQEYANARGSICADIKSITHNNSQSNRRFGTSFNTNNNDRSNDNRSMGSSKSAFSIIRRSTATIDEDHPDLLMENNCSLNQPIFSRMNNDLPLNDYSQILPESITSRNEHGYRPSYPLTTSITPPPRPPPPRLDDALNALLSCSIAEKQMNERPAQNTANNATQLTKDTRQISAPSLLASNKQTKLNADSWKRRFSVDVAEKMLEDIVREARRIKKASSNSLKRRLKCRTSKDQFTKSTFNRHLGSSHSVDTPDTEDSMSITSEDSSTISLDTPEQNGERGEQVARTRQTNLKRSPLCHGIYDSIATEPREWLDILARLRREHAKMAEPTSSDVISKLMHCAEYNDGLFPPSDELTAVSPMVEATQSKICYRDNTIEVNTSNVNDTCSTNKMQHRTHQPIPFIAVTAVSDATQTMENSHQATGTRRQRSLIPRRSTKRTLVADQKRQPASVQPSSTLFHSIEQPESNAMLLSINDNVPRLHDRQRAKRGLAILSKTAPRRSSPLAHTIASNELPTTNGEKQPPSKLPIWKGHANRRVANNESVRDSAHHHHPCSRDGDNDDVLTQDESDGLARLMNRLTTELAIADREAASIAAGELLKPPSAPFVDDDDDEVRKVCGRGTPPKRWLEGGSLLRDKLTVPALSGDDPEDDLPITVIFDSDSSQHEYFYSPAGIGRTTCSTTTTKINSDNNNMHDDRHGFPRNEMDVRISVDNLLQRCLT